MMWIEEDFTKKGDKIGNGKVFPLIPKTLSEAEENMYMKTEISRDLEVLLENKAN